MSPTDPSPPRAPARDDPMTGGGGDDPSGHRAPRELVVLALVVTTAGVVVRFVTRSPMWLDEALSVNIAHLPLSQLVEALRHDGHPPLYYALLHIWMGLFGEGDVAVRALSGLVAVAALPLVWLAGRRRGGSLLAWLSLTVLAVAPFAVRYATEARMYSLLVAFVLAGWLLVDRALRDGHDGLGWLVAIGAVTACLLYTHYWSMWLVATTLGLLAWKAWRGPDPDGRRRARRVLVAVLVGSLVFVPWLPVLADQAAHTGTPWAGPQRPTSAVASTLTDFGGGDFRDAELTGGILLLLALLGVFGRAVDPRRIEIDLRGNPQLVREALTLAGTLALGLLASYVTWSAYATRYAAVVFPFMVLLVAGGLSRFAGRWVRDAAAVSVVALCLLGVVYNVRGLRSQARVIGEAVAAQAAPGDLVVYCPDQLGPAGAREMPADVAQVVYPTLGPPQRIDWRDYEARNKAADPDAIAAAILAQAGSHQIFVVWSGSYQTFEGQCERLVEVLSTARGGSHVLVAEDGDTYYEHAQLVRIPAGA